MIWPFLLEKTANKYVHTVANALFVWFALLVVDKKSINFVSRMFLMLHYDLIFESEIKKPNSKLAINYVDKSCISQKFP